MTLIQLWCHFICTGWLLTTTYHRLVLTNKQTNIIALTALRLLAIGSIFSFFAPIYLWMKFSNFIQPAINDGVYWLIWAYIFLVGLGALIQTVFGIFWTTRQAQRIYNQIDTDEVIVKPFKPMVVKNDKRVA